MAMHVLHGGYENNYNGSSWLPKGRDLWWSPAKADDHEVARGLDQREIC
jgi:hypothetical protein